MHFFRLHRTSREFGVLASINHQFFNSGRYQQIQWYNSDETAVVFKPRYWQLILLHSAFLPADGRSLGKAERLQLAQTTSDSGSACRL
jgi:hypothetical protein